MSKHRQCGLGKRNALALVAGRNFPFSVKRPRQKSELRIVLEIVLPEFSEVKRASILERLELALVMNQPIGSRPRILRAPPAEVLQ